MSLALLLPAGLATLFALLLPLVLHLARRTEQQPTMFAALRWLQARQRPQRRIHFEERLLLLLRLLLLAALALLLAQPVLHGALNARAWVVVAPGIARATAKAAIAAPNAEWRWLAPGFPALERDPPAGTQAVSSLLRELDATLDDDATLTVLVPARLDGLDGERVVVRRKVEWRVIEAEVAGPPAAPQATAALSVRHQHPDDPALPYLRATGAAWQASAAAAEAQRVRVDFARASAPLGSDARWLVWLAPGELPPAIRGWIEAGGTALLGRATEAPSAHDGSVLWRNAEGQPLVTGHALGNGRVMRLTRELAPATLPEVLDPAFPDRLRRLFDPPPLPHSAFAETHAPLSGGAASSATPRPLQRWLALLVAALFVVERWLATSPRRQSPA